MVIGGGTVERWPYIHRFGLISESQSGERSCRDALDLLLSPILDEELVVRSTEPVSGEVAGDIDRGLGRRRSRLHIHALLASEC